MLEIAGISRKFLVSGIETELDPSFKFIISYYTARFQLAENRVRDLHK